MEDARDDSGGGGGMTSFGRNLVGGCFKPNSTVASPGSSVVLTSNEVEDGEKSSADGLHGKELEKIPKEGSLSSASGFHGKELENIPKEGILGHHIIGSLTAQGQELLGIDEGRPSNEMIDVYQCFSVAEINHVVSLPGPINIKVSGLESLGKAPEVYRIINDKIKSHRKWRCPRLPLIHTLGKISDRIKQLHKVLPRVKVRNGNTKASAKALRTTAFIKKKARSLEKVIQGGAVAQVLCRCIETDQPHFLQLHSEELTEMAKEEYDSPVWFLPLQMPAQAVAYCDRVYEEGAQQPSKSNIYFNLLQIYLNPRKVEKEFEQKIVPVASQYPGIQKARATKVKEGRTGKKFVEIEGADDIRFSPSGTDSRRSDGDGDDVSDGGPIMLNEALELLSQRWDRINGAQALRLLPRDTKLQVKEDLYKRRQAVVKIDGDNMCSLCHKRIANSAFAIYPNGQTLVHFVCFRESQQIKAVRGANSVKRR